jgi:nucleotide-binding universal stress UspA family protein
VIADGPIKNSCNFERNAALGPTVAHLTDFSEASAEAFLHALALALAYKHRLYLLHVKDPEREDSWSSFPHVREALARWGLVAADVTRSEIEEKLGIQVAKVEIESNDLAGGIFNFILSHRPDVFVLATHGREGLDPITAWFQGRGDRAPHSCAGNFYRA